MEEYSSIFLEEEEYYSMETHIIFLPIKLSQNDWLQCGFRLHWKKNSSLEFGHYFYMYIYQDFLSYPIFLKTFWVLLSLILSWNNGMGGKQDLDTGISMILVLCPILLFRVNMYSASTTPYTRMHRLAPAILFVLAMTTSSIDGTVISSWPWKKDDAHDLWKCRACVSTVERPMKPPEFDILTEDGT